jgi:transcriptional regulator with XRE-family HTH domain
MISEALRLIRVYHDLTQSEVAERLKISKSYLSEIESGTKVPTLALIDSYAEEFDLPASAILFFAENMDDPSAAGQARQFVSRKILTLLRFLEARSEPKHARKKRGIST